LIGKWILIFGVVLIVVGAVVWWVERLGLPHLIQRLTEPGQFVLDPFCGGEQVPAACRAIGRKWLAAEINQTTALVARKRLAEMDSGKRKGRRSS